MNDNEKKQEELNDDPFKNVNDDPFKDVVNEEEKTETTEVVETVEQEEKPKEEEYFGPTVKTITKYDYRTMKYFNMYNMIYKRHFNILYIVFAVASLGLGGYNAYSGIVNTLAQENGKIGYQTFIFPALFVFFAGYFLYQAFFFEKTIDKNITAHFARNPKVVKIETVVTEKYISLKVDGQAEPFKYDWAFVNDIAEIPQYYFLFLKGQPIIIEKDPSKVVEGEYADLVKMVMDKTSVKPYKKIEKELVKKPITYIHQEQIDEAHEVEANEVVEEKNDNSDENKAE